MANRTRHAAYKLIVELSKLQDQVDSEVWAEICKYKKRLKAKGYCINTKRSEEPDYNEMAEHIRKEAESKIANRRKYALYGNMKPEELERAWQTIPELRIEFENNFQWFVKRIQETFPESPANWIVNDLHLRSLSDEHHEKMIRDYELKQVRQSIGEAGDDMKVKSGTMKLKIEAMCDQVFICYSRKDKRRLDDLQTHLKPYVRNGTVTAWSDQQISPGSKWLQEIKEALACTKVAVLLVTPDFLASDFIHENELCPILKEAEKGKVTIIWIPIRSCAYKETPLKDYQAAVEPDKPLANMKAERDNAWVNICEKIKKAVSR
ncbi:MAG: toll/interleukin-1 receptor domain-containing protein [Sedimentisphaerales bacterium]|nr:toll/interleukin-1 receptor domain-containing protein [Sedimentisphaerales bacterium]